MTEETENIIETHIDKEEEDAIFAELAKVEGLSEYLRDTMNLDIMRYFQCTPEQQQLVKGAYMRTWNFSQKLKKAKVALLKVDGK